MAEYRVDEMVAMVYLYGECHQNLSATVRMYAQRYPNRRHPARQTLHGIVRRFNETGSVVHRDRPGRPRHVSNDDTSTVILASVVVNPHTSSRAIAADVGCSHSSVLNVLHSHKYHPYHVHCHQALREHDYNTRVEFCNWLLCCLQDDPMFLRSIIWSDEAQLSRNGVVNTHNLHYWATTNPHWLRETTHQDNWRINVWCGLYNQQLIGPVFYGGTLTGERYDILLNTTINDFVEALPLAQLRNVWFQQDGAPPHYAAVARATLDAMFGDHWIGRAGPIAWPPRSPDLTPMDFFLWGYIKSCVYETPPTTLMDLQERITQACARVTPNTLLAVHTSIQHRAEMCVGADGRQFEHIMP